MSEAAHGADVSPRAWLRVSQRALYVYTPSSRLFQAGCPPRRDVTRVCLS